MPHCGKGSKDQLVARRAALLDRCGVCSEVPGHCIIGPELSGARAYYVVGPSIQLIEGDKRPKHRRFLVAVFVWGITLDRWFPLGYYHRFEWARDAAFDRARHLTGGPIEPWCGPDFMAGPVPGRRVPIMISRR